MTHATSHDPERNATTTRQEEERKARAKLADPDVGSPQEGDASVDDKPGG